MVMITKGDEKKPEGVVSVTRGGIPVPQDADVASCLIRAAEKPQRLAHSGPHLSDGFSRASSHVTALTWQ
jgi:hypothetical protein